MTAILEEFVDLNRLDTVAREPIIREKKTETQPTAHQFGESFGGIFESSIGHETPMLEGLSAFICSGRHQGIPPFQ